MFDIVFSIEFNENSQNFKYLVKTVFLYKFNKNHAKHIIFSFSENLQINSAREPRNSASEPPNSASGPKIPLVSPEFRQWTPEFR